MAIQEDPSEPWKYAAFYSHCWGEEARYHQRVKRIDQALESEYNIKGWLDETQMVAAAGRKGRAAAPRIASQLACPLRLAGPLSQAMAHGIFDSAVTTIFLTNCYLAKARGSTHIRLEIDYGK